MKNILKFTLNCSNLFLKNNSSLNKSKLVTNLRFLNTSSISFKDNKNAQFEFELNKFNDVHIKLKNMLKFNNEIGSNQEMFESTLKNSLDKWSAEKRSSVWLYFPIEMSNFITISAKYGFKYHHAENDLAVLYKWLPADRESKVPLFATHQMGVAGVVYRADKNEILFVKDRVQVKNFWKLPGGAANLGEDIQETSVREVFEETGIKTKFASVVAFRQQHNYPSAHGRSDLYVICRLEPLTFEINACKDEIKVCEWINLDKMIDYTENQLTKRISKLIKYGKEKGFDKIDICPYKMNSPFAGRFYNLFHRDVKLE